MFLNIYEEIQQFLSITKREAHVSWNVPCQLKSCQLSRNSAETTCTTSPEPNISCRWSASKVTTLRRYTNLFIIIIIIIIIIDWPVRQSRAVDSAWRSVR